MNIQKIRNACFFGLSCGWLSEVPLQALGVPPGCRGPRAPPAPRAPTGVRRDQRVKVNADRVPSDSAARGNALAVRGLGGGPHGRRFRWVRKGGSSCLLSPSAPGPGRRLRAHRLLPGSLDRGFWPARRSLGFLNEKNICSRARFLILLLKERPLPVPRCPCLTVPSFLPPLVLSDH